MFRELINHCRSFVSKITGNRRYALQPIRVLPAIGLMLVAAASAHAEGSMSDGPPGGQGYFPVERPYNVDHATVRHHASTYQEGVLNGMSNYIQAIGVARVNHAQAMILEEQAKWANYKNKLARIDTFNERRRIHRERLAEDREYARLRDEEGKQQLEERRATDYREAYRLSRQEFNPSTGEIYWPEALQSQQFKAERERLTRLFAYRSEYNLERDHSAVKEIGTVQKVLVARLKNTRSEMSRDEYLAAYKFVVGLKYEALYG